MNSENQHIIRVLIVDDSLVSRKLHQKIVAGDDSFVVVGAARNGQEAIEKVKQLKPDVVSMDVNMPHLDGIEATREVMRIHPVPIIIVSSLYNEKEKHLAVEAAAAGAVYIMPKPNGIGHKDHEKDAKKYLRMLKNMAEVKVVGRRNYTQPSAPSEKRPRTGSSITAVNREVVVIGASAGGPQAINSILEIMPSDFPLPILLVQHLDKNFTQSFKAWLESFSKLPVIIAEDNQKIQGGCVYLAPGGMNMMFREKGVLRITRDAEGKSHIPSVASLFSSAAHFYREKTTAILLSGMGKDGARELLKLKQLGAFTMVQDKNSCLVFGMPGEAVKLDAANAVLGTADIVKELRKIKYD